MKIYKVWFVGFFIFSILAIWLDAAEPKTESERTNIYLRVVAVNPSRKEVQTVEVKNYLPPEVTPESVVSTGGLKLKYDKKRSLHYLYKKDIKLAAGKIRIFTIVLKDVWFIPGKELDSLKAQSQNLLNRTKKGKQDETAKMLAGKVNKQLEEIAVSQEKARAGPFKEQIVNYRNNQETLKQIRKDLKQLQRLTKKRKVGKVSRP